MIKDQPIIKLGGIKYQTKRYMAGPDERYLLEVGGKPGSGLGDLLLIEQFEDMRVKDFPDGLHISLHHPNTPLGLLESFTLLCQQRRSKATFTLFYSPENWNKPRNLWHYTKELAGKLLGELNEAKAASVGQDQGHTWIDIELDIRAQEEIRDYLVDLENRIKLISQQVSGEHSAPKSKPTHADLKPDEKGFKWWLRYIVVPVLGSAGLIGLIKLFARQA